MSLESTKYKWQDSGAGMMTLHAGGQRKEVLLIPSQSYFQSLRRHLSAFPWRTELLIQVMAQNNKGQLHQAIPSSQISAPLKKEKGNSEKNGVKKWASNTVRTAAFSLETC